MEGRGLISLVCDALSETHSLAYEMHAQLYAHDPADDRDLRQLNDEALSCLQTAEHYLLMLGSVIEERIPPDHRTRTRRLIRGRWSPRSDPLVRCRA